MHQFEQALGYGEGQGSLACYGPRGHKKSDMIEWLNNNNWDAKVMVKKSKALMENILDLQSLHKKLSIEQFIELVRD